MAHVFADSRSVYRHSEALFICLPGARVHGHHFIAQLYSEGVRCFVVERDFLEKAGVQAPDAILLGADDTLKAFQQIAALYREKYSGHVTAITGSNGKTIVKEWLSYLLRASGQNIWASPKSYNSQFGVPLSLSLADENAERWLLEAGISKKGEMERLETMIQPDAGIFTHLGEAHNEGFKDKMEKLADKCSLFRHCTVIFYPENEPSVGDYLQHEFPGKTLIGFHAGVTPLSPSFTDSASLQNAVACAAWLQYFYPEKPIESWAWSSLPQIEMRLQVLSGAERRTLINDSYNADLDGLNNALDLALQQNRPAGIYAILGKFEQSGMSDAELYASIGKLMRQYSVKGLIAVGIPQNDALQSAVHDVYSFDNTADLKSHIDVLLPPDCTVLLKGSRSSSLDSLLPLLAESRHGTRLEINLSAMARNYQRLKSLLKPQTRTMAMVKAEAYGSGAYHVAKLMEQQGADYLAVAYLNEGISLRNAGIKLPVMVMNPSPDSWDRLWQYNLEPEIFGMHQLESLHQFATANPDKPLKVHVEIDSGMSRLGFLPHEIEALAVALNRFDTIRVASVFSHLAAADEAKHDPFTQQQAETFENAAMKLRQMLRQDITPLLHLLNSPGIIRHSQYQFDMVRIGIGLYGIGAGDENPLGLEPVAALKTVVSQVKHVSAGTTIGYGRHGVLSQDSLIAVLDIGYADGLPRRLGRGNFHVKVNGTEAPIIGNVCMDMTMINVGKTTARAGDEAVIFDDLEGIEKLAAALDTIPYEILSSLSPRVKRVYWHE